MSQSSAIAPLVNLRANAAALPRRPALTFAGRSMTYRALEAAVRRRTSALCRLGLEPGDPIAILLPSSPAAIIYDLAAKSAGFAACPLDPLRPPATIAAALASAGARVLVTSDATAHHAMAYTLLHRGSLDKLLIVPHGSQMSYGAALKLRFGGGLARLSASPPGQIVRETSLLREAAGQTTPLPSAKTGSSEAARNELGRTESAKSANVAQMLEALPSLRPGLERILAAVPLSDPLVLNIASGMALACAAELVIPVTLAPRDLVRALYNHAPTLLLASMPRLEALLASPILKSRSFRNLKATVTFGPPHVQRTPEVFAALTKAPVIETIGSRAVAACAVTQRDAPASTAGAFVPLSATRFTVRDLADPNREVPRGERGVLRVTGPQFSSRPGDPSWPTGDVGLIDGRGHVVVICPEAEVVIAAGYMIYPSRIELALLEHPGVADAAVLGIRDGRRGMVPKAFVLRKSGAAVTGPDLAKHLAQRISKIEMPSDIVFCPSLPRDAFGSVDKTALRAKAASSP